MSTARWYVALAPRRPADEDRADGRNTLTRFADIDACTPGHYMRCPECGVPLELGHDCIAGDPE